MEFWGVEVKSGQPLEVNLGVGKVLHLSQACLGETKNNKANESVCLHINIEEKKLVLGTLHPERLPQQLFDLVFDKDFQLSHNWKNGSVYFYGYKADQPNDDEDESEDIDTDEEEEALRLPIGPIRNGKNEEDKKLENLAGPSKKNTAGKQKVTIVEPEKDDKADSDDSDDSSDDASDSDEDDSDSSDDDDEEDSDEEEETPKKEQSGKKRPNESATKTPVTDKKAKLSTPSKTDGKKAVGHVATPHPSKQAVAKTPGNKSNQKSSASASDGAHSCKSCNRTFKSDNALQSHNQAKHK